MFVFYAIPVYLVLAIIGIRIYEAHLARQRAPRPRTPEEVRARLAIEFPALMPYDRERDGR